MSALYQRPSRSIQNARRKQSLRTHPSPAVAVEVALSALYTAAWLLLGWSTRLRAILKG